MASSLVTETKLLVLRLLHETRTGLYGLQLVSNSEWKLKRSTVYRTLGQLEEKLSAPRIMRFSVAEA